jgi:putative endonuclease
MSDRRKKLGDFGEQVALAYLTRQGYALIARQWRCPVGEIDLLMRDRAGLVFVEVRTRRGQGASIPEESIGRAKQARLSALAYTYLESTGAPANLAWRIDVVAVEIDHSGRVANVRHIQDAIEEA